MKTVAFASTAHEFRNPLGSIIQSLELLELFDLIPEALPYVENAKNCTNLMLFLVNDILDFAQLEEKKIVINMDQAVSLMKIVSECT